MNSKKNMLITGITAYITLVASAQLLADEVFVPGALFGKVSSAPYGILMQKSPNSIQDYEDTYGRSQEGNQSYTLPGIYLDQPQGQMSLEELNNINRLQANQSEIKRKKLKMQYLHKKAFNNHKRIEASEQ